MKNFFASFSFHNDDILCLTVSHNNEQIVVGSRDRLIIVLRLETGEIEQTVDQHTDAVVSVALTQDDSILISGKSITDDQIGRASCRERV